MLRKYVRSTSEQDEEEQLIALIESLKGPMAAQGASLKQYMKDAFLPAYNGIKSAHGVLEEKGEWFGDYMRLIDYNSMRLAHFAVDLAFGAGLLTFDEVCKKVERIALRDEDELRSAHAQAQVRPSAAARSWPTSCPLWIAQHGKDPRGA